MFKNEERKTITATTSSLSGTCIPPLWATTTTTTTTTSTTITKTVNNSNNSNNSNNNIPTPIIGASSCLRYNANHVSLESMFNARTVTTVFCISPSDGRPVGLDSCKSAAVANYLHYTFLESMFDARTVATVMRPAPSDDRPI
ncbi:unnamed protein product [Polarella glacialis]|uniref:Uncharacterized protein n=1 Tax=Polarella glacialis TaxID=89957 RepID=A0A813I2W0_POLGL|nr:unnamed protein product [Polarella glacialis]